MAQHREGMHVLSNNGSMQSSVCLPPPRAMLPANMHATMTRDVPVTIAPAISPYSALQSPPHGNMHFYPGQSHASNLNHHQQQQQRLKHHHHQQMPHQLQHANPPPSSYHHEQAMADHLSHAPSHLPLQTMPTNIGPSGKDGAFSDSRRYQLVVVQQPVRARMCGFGEKDRRPVDPPPVVRLVVLDSNNQQDEEMQRSPFFIVHVTLRAADDPRLALDIIQLEPSGSSMHSANSGSRDSSAYPGSGNAGGAPGMSASSSTRDSPSSTPVRRTSGAHNTRGNTTTTRVMMGTLVSSPSVLKDERGITGCFFCFPDLSIRCEGSYRLRFTLVKLNPFDDGDDEDCDGNVVAEIDSDPFTVYSAKRFPGMTESTELSKAFARQGLKIPIRNDVRKRNSDAA
ncbi:velvet factor-domain-containing protein [Syncephalis fuscata]|nr:velvet factor-domain-containing protein [Syncephalis fuscata]